MPPDRIPKYLGRTIKAGYIVTPIKADFSVNIPGALHHSQRFQTGPIFFVVKPIDITGCYISTGFNAAMPTIYRFMFIERIPCFFHAIHVVNKKDYIILKVV